MKVLVSLSALLGFVAANVQLTEKNFKSSLEGKNAIVMFQAPW
jgi:hypothetical protein